MGGFLGFPQITPHVFLTPIGSSQAARWRNALDLFVSKILSKEAPNVVAYTVAWCSGCLISRKFTMTGGCVDPFCIFLPSFFWGGGRGHSYWGRLKLDAKLCWILRDFLETKNRAFVWVGNTKTAVGAASLRDCWCIKCNCAIQPMKRGHIERNNYLPTAIFQG